MYDWEYDKDPFGIIPIGYKSNLVWMPVVGFSAPRGDDIKKLMVKIGNSDEKYTTMKYMVVLRDYFISLSLMDFLNKFG
jgi:hypothetical protein